MDHLAGVVMTRWKTLSLIGICWVFAGSALTSAAPNQDNAPGRLFFTPERRAALDRQRELKIQEVQTVQSETLRLDGVVQRTGGRNTYWINGRLQTESAAQTSGVSIGVKPRNPGSAEIRLGDEPATPVNVGEAINRTTGERDTRLGGGSVVRHPAR
jgi:hypothetical protein